MKRLIYASTSCLMLLVAGGLLIQTVWANPTKTVTGLEVTVEPYDELHPFEAPFVEAADRIKPSVVTITSTSKVESSGVSRHDLDGFKFERFFGGNFEGFFEQAPQSYARQGMGSGVIVDPQGYILTNNHVINDADKLEVHLYNDQTYEAELIGADPKTDLALIKIDANGLKAATLGMSDYIRVGQWVMAVGNPFGLSQTVTTGIVSETNREGIGVAQYESFIQTDAAINHGNSGGPLINLKGQVIGINTAIMSRNGGNNGVGLAIPIDMARDIMEDLIDDGAVTRGWLGVTIQQLTPELAQTFGYEGDGVLIGDVMTGSPAADAGLRIGDIVLRADGRDVLDVSGFRHQIARAEPENKLEFEVWRDEKKRTLKVKIGQMPDEATSGWQGVMSGDLMLGLKLSDPERETLRYFRLPDDVEGAVVTELKPDSPAARAGMEPGDVITSVQGEAVSDAAEAKRELSKHDAKKGIRLSVQRGDWQRFVFIQSD